MKVADLIVRVAEYSDAESIAALFAEDGVNAYGWSADKWLHYYRDYPEGDAIAVVVEYKNRIIGHYGLLPVKIGVYKAMLGLHAYVSAQYRGLTIISSLMKQVDSICQKESVSLLVGFANPAFTKIKQTLFKWNTLLWLKFVNNPEMDSLIRCNEPFYFDYSDDWYLWRFGEKRSIYISRYIDQNKNLKKQLLKVANKAELKKLDITELQSWGKQANLRTAAIDEFSQPFSIKIYDEKLLEKGALEINNWFIEMGDSDTFQYTAWE